MKKQNTDGAAYGECKSGPETGRRPRPASKHKTGHIKNKKHTELHLVSVKAARNPDGDHGRPQTQDKKNIMSKTIKHKKNRRSCIWLVRKLPRIRTETPAGLKT